jgi:hypothetical protein
MIAGDVQPLSSMRIGALIAVGGMLSAIATSAVAHQAVVPPPPQTDAERAALLDRVLANQKKSDAAMLVYERVERLEARKTGSDPAPAENKTSRVVPAGTGVDHIPIGPDGKPTDAASYHTELIKLEKTLSWAADDGHAQRDAYDRVARKQKERDELIDATRAAFLYKLIGTEKRDGRVLYKYSMEPNPAYKPTSRATTIFSKVKGFVWIDPAAGEMARIEGEVTGDISIALFLAKINKGSHFMQERHEVTPGLWMPTFSEYDFDGRKLFSSIAVHERTFYSQYRRIGPPKEALARVRAELGMTASGVSDP